ncbi:hypothetical protein C7M84_022699 [Penaeus vannamei]|uniref:Uncharacterized protein n=1 Tax=Penaeus vannamei TaxID=6689 RepID=A0A3R7QMT4_PENVA|nr:hypothetical protein C7M84_022699 [Penaeus vannamei]
MSIEDPPRNDTANFTRLPKVLGCGKAIRSRRVQTQIPLPLPHPHPHQFTPRSTPNPPHFDPPAQPLQDPPPPSPPPTHHPPQRTFKIPKGAPAARPSAPSSHRINNGYLSLSRSLSSLSSLWWFSLSHFSLSCYSLVSRTLIICLRLVSLFVKTLTSTHHVHLDADASPPFFSFFLVSFLRLLHLARCVLIALSPRLFLSSSSPPSLSSSSRALWSVSISFSPSSLSSPSPSSLPPSRPDPLPPLPSSVLVLLSPPSRLYLSSFSLPSFFCYFRSHFASLYFSPLLPSPLLSPPNLPSLSFLSLLFSLSLLSLSLSSLSLSSPPSLPPLLPSSLLLPPLPLRPVLSLLSPATSLSSPIFSHSPLPLSLSSAINLSSLSHPLFPPSSFFFSLPAERYLPLCL